MARSSLVPLLTLLLAALPLAAQPTDQALVERIAKEAKIGVKYEESDSFVWASEVPPAVLKPVIQTAEKGMKAWQEISGLEGYRDVFGKDKCLVVITKGKLQAKRFAEWYEKNHTLYWEGFADVATQGEFFPMPSPRPMIMVHLKPLKNEALAGTVTHELGRLLMMRFAWNNNAIPPWLEEGFGVYLEARVTGKNICFSFGGGYGDAKGGSEKFVNITWAKWKGVISGMAAKRRFKTMEAILPLRLSTLSVDEVGKAMSIIDFMITKDTKAFCRFVQRMKSHWPREFRPEFDPAHQTAQEKALKESFDWTLDELDKAWEAYVGKGHKL